MPTRTADAVWGGSVAQEDHTRRASAAHAPRFAPLHAIGTLACETRRVLTAIVERATLACSTPGKLSRLAAPSLVSFSVMMTRGTYGKPFSNLRKNGFAALTDRK